MAAPVSGIPFLTPMVEGGKVQQPTWKQWFDSLVARVNGAPDAVTFDELPPAPNLYQQAVISDSTTAVWGAVIAGGGGNLVLAFYNGTDWTVIGK